MTKVIAGPDVAKSYIDKADPVYGDWNVRIKAGSNGTTINVNIVNLTYESVVNKISTQKQLNSFKSTGVFENIISDLIK